MISMDMGIKRWPLHSGSWRDFPKMLDPFSNLLGVDKYYGHFLTCNRKYISFLQLLENHFDNLKLVLNNNPLRFETTKGSKQRVEQVRLTHPFSKMRSLVGSTALLCEAGSWNIRLLPFMFWVQLRELLFSSQKWFSNDSNVRGWLRGMNA